MTSDKDEDDKDEDDKDEDDKDEDDKNEDDKNEDDKNEDDKDEDDKNEDDKNENLSDNLQSFIDANYVDYSIKDISTDSLCGETAVIIIALQKMSKKIDVYFDEEERFLHEAEDIKKKDIPDEVIEAVESNFEEYQIKNNAIKYIKQDGTIQYSLSLFKGNMGKEVIVNADGTIVCEP